MPMKIATEVLMPVTICTQIMKKSNLFHVSLMYCFQPSPCHLTKNSMLYTPLKHVLICVGLGVGVGSGRSRP